MSILIRTIAAALLVAAPAVSSAWSQQLAASPTLDAIKARGHVECGVHLGLPGFSFANDKGEWTGLDVDYCRSLAAAVLGDSSKVKFTPTSVQQRWAVLQSGQVDLLSRNTTITFSRNATLGVNFQGINFYEGQTFVVRTKAKVAEVKDLADATICVAAGSTEEKMAADWFRERNLKVTIINFQKNDDAISAYDQGRCDAYTAGIGALAGQRIKFKSPEEHQVLSEIISNDPQGPVTRWGDERWQLVVRWVLNGTIAAEALGVTSKNVDEMKAKSTNSEVRRLLGVEGKFGEMMGLSNDWMYNAIKQVGNYGETYERSVGMESPLKLKRGANQLWTKGGLLFTPPFQRGRAGVLPSRKSEGSGEGARLIRFLRDRKVRDVFWQGLATVALLAAAWFFVQNASENMLKAGMAAGFQFLWRDSGIEVPFNLTGYKPSDTILALLWTGIVNTILVSIVSIAVATVIGFSVGLLRLSRNWLLSSLAGFYIEFVRNIPLLFFVLFWYFGVLAALPAPRESLSLFDALFLNRRGLSIPTPNDVAGFQLAIVGGLVLIALQAGIARWARLRQARTGRGFPIWAVGVLLCGVLPIAALIVAGFTTAWEMPTLRGFNYRGGFVLVPEFVALFAALSTYTAAFIAEVVRGGIQSVRQGQIDAAKALGLTPGQVVRLVVIPQAMPVIIPPITSQYLNLIKNSSFGAAIAYPDIVSVFMGSALVATGQAVEIIAITLAIYLALSLAVSLFMNWYNARHKLVTR